MLLLFVSDYILLSHASALCSRLFYHMIWDYTNRYAGSTGRPKSMQYFSIPPFSRDYLCLKANVDGVPPILQYRMFTKIPKLTFVYFHQLFGSFSHPQQEILCVRVIVWCYTHEKFERLFLDHGKPHPLDAVPTTNVAQFSLIWDRQTSQNTWMYMEGWKDDGECWCGLLKKKVAFEVLFSSIEPANALLRACTLRDLRLAWIKSCVFQNVRPAICLLIKKALFLLVNHVINAQHHLCLALGRAYHTHLCA